MFNSNVLDEATVNRLLDAAANVDVAQNFNSPSFLNMLVEARDSPTTGKDVQYAINRLISRIHGWEIYEDALSNAHGDFYDSARLLKDVGTGEQSLGVWLESMIIHDVIPMKLAQNVVPSSQILPPLLFNEKAGSVTHDEFITFVRAFVGISSVLAVWAWSDSIGHDVCREQSLAVLYLWQSVSGYREVRIDCFIRLLMMTVFNNRLLIIFCYCDNLRADWDGSLQIMLFHGILALLQSESS